MGGVPALLLVIAAGITYGWQPDREGGVEYIIQVPPDQVERLAQIGEISSVIDPEVRGHVSRVVIRVGTGPIPQNTPAHLSGRAAGTQSLGSSELAVLDAAPLPIPEMADGNTPEPIPGFYGARNTGAQSVLKPDANSPQGTSAYGFPALPPTLHSTGAPQIDQAGREISSPPTSQANSIFGPSIVNPNAASGPPANAAAPSSTVIRVPPPATRSPAPTSAATPPPFTGSDPQGDYARARAGGPSTDPTNVRDNTWRDFPPPPSTTSSGLTTAGQSQENPFQTPGTTSAAIPNTTSGYSTGAPTAGSTSTYSTSGSNGLAPGDTYGKLPSGFNLTANGDRNAGGTPAGNPTANAYGATNYGASTNGYGATNSAGSAYAAGPDPRLTPVQVAAGAWSVDSYGRILDRQGRTMNASSFSASSAGAAAPGAVATTNQQSSPNRELGGGSGFGTGSGFPASAATIFGANTDANSSPLNSSLGPPTLQGTSGFSQLPNSSGFDRNQPLSRTVPSDFGAVRTTAESQRELVRPTSSAPTVDSNAREARVERRDDPPSLTENRSVSGSAVGEHSREVVAPQPLFNGLLLISLVANVYLIFWLKNLRIQFRDLVAAKRMAASSSSQ